jgi:hypothetical protein
MATIEERVELLEGRIQGDSRHDRRDCLSSCGGCVDFYRMETESKLLRFFHTYVVFCGGNSPLQILPKS